MSTPSDRRGATLPLAILAIVIISLTVAAGYARVSAERRINSDQQAQVDAFAVAQTGLERYINGVASIPGASDNVTITTIPGGSAEISLRRIRDATATTPALYVVSSRGTSTGSSRFGASTAPAQRTVGQYAIWQPGEMEVQSAWTSITGLHKHGASGVLSGHDQCGKKADVAGVAVPADPGYTQTGGESVPAGVPPIGSLGADTAQAKNEVPIDWNAILNGNAITPDITIPGQNWPAGSQWNSWPVIRVNGDTDIPDGKGILIVTGNATVSGNTTWKGVVLVGGNLTSNGNTTVLGSVVTGLNVKLGMAVPLVDLGNGNKSFIYNSCMVDSALTELGVFQRIQNAWTDDWPSY
jgi:Tfp pilus assembly protein PilX